MPPARPQAPGPATQNPRLALVPRPPFPRAHFQAALALFAALTLLFWVSDLDRSVAAHYFNHGLDAWPGRDWLLGRLCYRYGQQPAPLVGAAGLIAFLLSFGQPDRRAWRGPGLYLALLALLGPGLFANVLAKGLAGRPRPEETWGFGGLWEFHRPFQFGIPGRGRSFISGHASAAWYFLGLPFLFDGLRRRWAFGLVLAYGLLMSWIRVAQGAHWLSDCLLAGAGLYALAAGLSPLIHWQPSDAFFRRPDLRWTLGLGVLAALSLTGVNYEGIRVLGGAVGPSSGPQAPQLRLVPGPAQGPVTDVMADVDLAAGSLNVDFDRPPGQPQPLQLDLELYGQGLPGCRTRVKVGPLPSGGAFDPGPGTLGVLVSGLLQGPFWSSGGESRLSLPSDLAVDVRLRVPGGSLSIGPLPAGRRVLVPEAPYNAVMPPSFEAYGAEGWLRNGKPPLISLDLEAKRVIFADTITAHGR